MMRPGRADITMTRSLRKTASSMLWVTNRTLFAERSAMDAKSTAICSRVIASSAPNGSSIKSIDGSCTSAQAKRDPLAHSRPRAGRDNCRRMLRRRPDARARARARGAVRPARPASEIAVRRCRAPTASPTADRVEMTRRPSGPFGPRNSAPPMRTLPVVGVFGRPATIDSSVLLAAARRPEHADEQ